MVDLPAPVSPVMAKIPVAPMGPPDRSTEKGAARLARFSPRIARMRKGRGLVSRSQGDAGKGVIAQDDERTRVMQTPRNDVHTRRDGGRASNSGERDVA